MLQAHSSCALTVTVHSARSRSTSSQWAPLASPLLAAVNMANRRQNLAASDAWDASTTPRAWATSSYGSALRWALNFGIGGNAPSMASPAGLLSMNPVGHGPPHDGADSLPDSPGGLGNGGSPALPPQMGVRTSPAHRLCLSGQPAYSPKWGRRAFPGSATKMKRASDSANAEGWHDGPGGRLPEMWERQIYVSRPPGPDP